MEEKTFKARLRHWRVANPYGPGMKYPPSAYEGPVEKLTNVPLSEVAIVLVHCWNIGEDGGPYPLSAVAKEQLPGQNPAKGLPWVNQNWVAEAMDCMKNVIAPCLAAAREAGMTVFHLASSAYADRYPQYAQVKEDQSLQSPPREAIMPPPCVQPVPTNERYAEVFGPDFPGAVWETHPDMFKIAKPVEPAGNDLVVIDGFQLSHLARRRGIRWLFYTGFMLNICLLDVPGAMREMAACGYRVAAISDASVAAECADTVEGKKVTSAFLRYIEYVLGYLITSKDFIKACTAANP